MPYSSYILYVFFSFWVSIYHFFLNFSKCTKSGTKTNSGTKTVTLKKITQKVQNWYLFVVFTNILYIVSTFRCVHWILRIHHTMQRTFFFWAEPFQWRFPRRHLYRSLLCSAHRGVVVLFFDFCFLFFFSVRFYTTVRFVRSEQKENIKIIREILSAKSMRHRKVYSKFYLRGERQPLLKNKHVK